MEGLVASSELYFLLKERSACPESWDKVISLEYAAVGYLIVANPFLPSPGSFRCTTALTFFSLTAPVLWKRMVFFYLHQPVQLEGPPALFIILRHNLWICPRTSFLLPQHAYFYIYLELHSPLQICTVNKESLPGLDTLQLSDIHYVLNLAFLHCQPLQHTRPPPPLIFPAWVTLREGDTNLGLLIPSGLNHRLASHFGAYHIHHTPNPVSHQILLIRPKRVHMYIFVDFILDVPVLSLTPMHTEHSYFSVLLSRPARSSTSFSSASSIPLIRQPFLVGKDDCAILWFTILQWLWVANKDQVHVDFYSSAYLSQTGLIKVLHSFAVYLSTCFLSHTYLVIDH